MSKFQVVITDSPWTDNSVELQILEEGGAQVTRAHCKTSSDVVHACGEADALLVGWAPITRDAIAHLNKCRLMMRYGTGYDNIDIAAATEAGIAVAINADYCVEEVSVHAFTLLLACHRQLAALRDAVQGGEWDPLQILLPCRPISEQTVGVLGYGRIGRRFAELASSVAKRVLIHDPAIIHGTAGGNDSFVSFDRLLAESDYISIHIPLSDASQNLFGRAVFARMKKGSYLINCSRGAIVDEEALLDALERGQLAGAALDVFAKEPLPLNHPLRKSPQVMVTPHSAWYSTRAEYLLRANPANNILRYLRGESIPLVNNPKQQPTNQI